VLLVLAGAGGWYVWKDIASRPSGVESAMAPTMATRDTSTVPTVPAAPPPPTDTAMQAIPSEPPATRMPLEAIAKSAQDLDAQFQQTTMWNVVKREFPDWYIEQLKEAARLSAENQPRLEIAKHLAQGLVELRRKHADQALAASTDKLKQVANAFLDNLRSLSAQSIGACYGFISQGETSPAVLEMMLSPNEGQTLKAQVAAIFEAIADGRRSPRSHEKAVKSDYEALVQQLTKLGWKEEDLKVFSNPSALSREPPARVCQMVQDWFVAHLSVQDKGAQERLLVETLKPVVSG
jgi:hypothetical protein